MDVEKKGRQLATLMISLPILIVIGLIVGRWLRVNFEHYEEHFAYWHWLFLGAFWLWNLYVVLSGGDPGTTDMSGWSGYGENLFGDGQSASSERVSSGESDPDAFEGPGDGD